MARSYRNRIREIGRDPAALAQEADQLAQTSQIIRDGIAEGALDPKRHGVFADTADMLERGMRVLSREAERAAHPESQRGCQRPRGPE